MSVVYPEWMVEKVGDIVFTDADFSKIDFKYGVAGTSPAGSVVKNIDHIYGGSGAVAITTGAVLNNTKVLLRNIPYVFDGNIVAFECKFIPDDTFSTNQFEMGFRLFIPAIGILDGHIVYDENTKTIMYQDGDDSFVPFVPVLDFPPPKADAVPGGLGDEYGWVRLSIDVTKLEFVSVQASGRRKKVKRDMRGLPLINVGGTATNKFVVRNVTQTKGAAAITSYTTDWAVTTF
jgi:hypothetical protein